MFIQNIIIEYNIFNLNIYNFNETGFFIRILNYTKIIITLNYKNKLYTK